MWPITSSYFLPTNQLSVFFTSQYCSELSPQSSEILFEVYDRSSSGTDTSTRFLGLGLVGIDELSVGPTSSQILSLQPRPYETDDVQGAITVEFVFIEGAEIPLGRRPYKMKEALKINNTSQLNGRRLYFIKFFVHSYTYVQGIGAYLMYAIEIFPRCSKR